MPLITYVAIVTAALAGFCVSMLWYGPLFGRLWRALTHFSDKEIEAQIQPGVSERMSLHIVMLIVGAFLLSYILERGGGHTVVGGALIGFLTAIFGSVIFVLGGVLSRPEKHQNVYVVALDLGHWLVVFSVVGGVLGLFL